MAYLLPHLTNGWQVDQAIVTEEERVVIIRFGRDWDPVCMRMDETLLKSSGAEWRRMAAHADIGMHALSFSLLCQSSSRTLP